MREYSVEIGAAVYRLAPLSAAQFQELCDRAKASLPDPVDEVLATAAKLPEAYRDKFLERHLDRAFEAKQKRGTVTDDLLHEYMRSPDGFRYTVGLLFKRYHPEVTEAQAFELVAQAIDQHGEGVFKTLVAAGQKVPLTEQEVEQKYFRGRRVGAGKAK